MKYLKLFSSLSLLCIGVVAWAGTIAITSPTAGKWIGASSLLEYKITGASTLVNVTAIIPGVNGNTQVSNTATPNATGDATGSLPLTFAPNMSSGDYTIELRAKEGNVDYTPVTVLVKVDVKSPKLLSYRPGLNSFIRGNLVSQFKLAEDNLKDWRITVNNADVPNNSGSGGTTIDFLYDTSGITNDGPINLNMNCSDFAGNTFGFQIPVTLDRKPPVTTIQFPQPTSPIRRKSDIRVLVDVADQFSNSVDLTGVDVVIQKTDGTFLGRVSRESFTEIGGNTWRWQGRLRYRAGLPSVYNIVVSALDKAGNSAVRQQVTVRPTN